MPETTRPPCSVTECHKPSKSRGWCPRHYARWLRHGTVEQSSASPIFDENYTPAGTVECWNWRGSFNTYGYGRHGSRMAHRVVYETYKGKIPDGLVIDHLCRNTACVNPSHLEPVTQGVNIIRGLNSYVLRTQCRNGLHDISDPSAVYVNTYGHRTCLECKRANDRRGDAKRLPRGRAKRR